MVSSIVVGLAGGGGGRLGRPAAASRRQGSGGTEQRQELGRLDLGAGERLADAAQQDEARAAALDLLVVRHRGDQRARARGRRPRSRRGEIGSPTAARWRRMRSASAAGQSPSRTESVGRQHDAERHRLAVQQAVAIAGERLQRMAEGVAEVEQRAGAASRARRPRPAPPWRGSSRGSRAAAAAASPASSAAPCSLEPGEELRPVDHAVLDHLGVARAQLPRPAGSPARRCPRARGAAGGSCRSGSCPGAR